ncbi:ribulose-phosphate 3-epimerase [Sporosarcina cascadiensis]|uniref:ribulose-phosphate 3-epimerase n=1 Tax=Sporosarcina cascadiensis TaxID=2660747 RepID=UPI00129B40DA|nr:ribulose-phosphate 3-epimerase [Sporosarcina cascadiensis]
MIVSASILSADFLNLERDIRLLEEKGTEFIHIDIMDGRFVTNITWGPATVKAIRKITELPIEVHLMIAEPERSIKNYLDSEADFFVIHPESTQFLRKTLLEIKNAGKKAGIALKLETPVDTIRHCLDVVDLVLFVTCDEGFGGQSFHPLSLEKIAEVAKWRKEYKLNFQIEVDGGINSETAAQCKAAGADIAVSGSFIFRDDIQEAIERLKSV